MRQIAFVTSLKARPVFCPEGVFMLKFEQTPAEHGPRVPSLSPASMESTNEDNVQVVLLKRNYRLVWEC